MDEQPAEKSLLKQVLAEAEKIQKDLPRLRTKAILPLGTMTAGEFRKMAAKESPEFAKLTKEEQFEVMNEAIRQTAEEITKAGGDYYMMDTVTFFALRKQQIKENEENFKKLLKLRDETVLAIENAPIDLPHAEKVRLQRRSVAIQRRILEFQQWLIENKLLVPITDVVRESQKAKRTKRRRTKPTGVPIWRGNKSEFCRFVQTEYGNHKDQYTSLRDATFKLFSQYSFSDKKWSAYDCYELVKKV